MRAFVYVFPLRFSVVAAIFEATKMAASGPQRNRNVNKHTHCNEIEDEYHFGRCENPECRNITEYGGISRNMAEYAGISRNITTFSRNIPEHHDILRW
jgi:hypothetical protein